jgi:hypothetical protein
MKKWIVRNLIRPQWVAFDCDGKPELGVKIFGVVFGMYKAETWFPSKPPTCRKPEKREFGESIRPV